MITYPYHVAEKYAKTFLGEKDIESVVHRLDRLTLEESKITAAQTLDVVCRLVNKMQVVMEGTHDASSISMSTCVIRDYNLVDGKTSTDDIRQTLSEPGWIT